MTCIGPLIATWTVGVDKRKPRRQRILVDDEIAAYREIYQTARQNGNGQNGKQQTANGNGQAQNGQTQNLTFTFQHDMILL